MGAARGATMAPNAKGKKSERDDVAVKIDRAIVAKAKAIANHHGTSAAEVLSEALIAPINKAYAAMLRELERGTV